MVEPARRVIDAPLDFATSASLSGRSLSIKDIDRDGAADLVVGLSSASGGWIFLYRGNLDPIYPNYPAAQLRRRQGIFSESPFLPNPLQLEAALRPDFLGLGDYDGDGVIDLLIAEHNSNRMALYSDALNPPERPLERTVSGEITAFLATELGMPNGVPELALGVEGENGPMLLVYRGVGSVVSGAPQTLSLPEPVSHLEAEQLAGTTIQDLVVASGHQLRILRRGVTGPGTQTLVLPEPIASLATGNFIQGAERELAVLLENGDLHWIAADGEAGPVSSSWSDVTAPPQVKDAEGSSDSEDAVWRISAPVRRGIDTGSVALARSRISANLTDELVFLDREANSLHLLENELGRGAADNAEETWLPGDLSEMALGSPPIKIASGRLNGDAIQDLVVLSESGDLKYTISGCATTFTVGSLDPGGDQSVIDFNFDGVCDADPDPEKVVCTLEAALEEAEMAAGPVCVQFSVAGTIQGVSGLDIYSSVFVDGSTAPGFSDRPVVEVDGGGASTGFSFKGGQSGLRGLAVTGFDTGFQGGTGIAVGSSEGNVIEGNFVGLALSGTEAKPNWNGMIGISNLNGMIGGFAPAARNFVTGNRQGIGITRDGSIIGNYVGTDVSGELPLPYPTDFGGPGISSGDRGQTLGNLVSGNPGLGISAPKEDGVIQGNAVGLTASGNPLGNALWGISGSTSVRGQFGGLVDGQGNVVAFNLRSGITLFRAPADLNTILSNSIFGNLEGGIDLGNDGPTPNDNGDLTADPPIPPDQDAGPNGLQNFPDLQFVANGQSVIATLFSTPDSDFQLQFFANSNCVAGQPGQGEEWLNTLDLTVPTDSSGLAQVEMTLPFGVEPEQVTATATQVLAGGKFGSTSEFSLCASEAPPLIVVNSVEDSPLLGCEVDDVQCITETPSCDTGKKIEKDGAMVAECTVRAAIQFVNNGLALQQQSDRSPLAKVDESRGSTSLPASDQDRQGGRGPLPTIAFDIPGAGPHNIALDQMLPPLKEPALVNAMTDSDGEVVLDASGLPVPEESETLFGFKLETNNATIRGLHVEGIESNDEFGEGFGEGATARAVGYWIVGNNNTLQGLRAIGGLVDNDDEGNAGIVVQGDNNQLGDPGHVQGLRLRNFDNGVWLRGDQNVVQGAELSMNGVGVRVDRGVKNVIGALDGLVPGVGCDGACNLIHGNDVGVVLRHPSRETGVYGNLIGTVRNGSSASPNRFGIIVSSSSNKIGDVFPPNRLAVSPARNVISGSLNDGLLVQGFPKLVISNFFQGNFIGTDITGQLPIGNRGDGISFTDQAFLNHLAYNRIAFNQGAGIRTGTGSPTGQDLSTNLIFENGEDGIQRVSTFGEGAVVYPPRVVSAVPGKVEIEFRGDALIAAEIEVYTNPFCGPNREGTRFAGVLEEDIGLVLDLDGGISGKFHVVGVENIEESPMVPGDFVTVTANQLVTSAFSDCVQIEADSDKDSASDKVEDDACGGDANGDGVPDRLQDNVVCLAESTTR